MKTFGSLSPLDYFHLYGTPYMKVLPRRTSDVNAVNLTNGRLVFFEETKLVHYFGGEE